MKKILSLLLIFVILLFPMTAGAEKYYFKDENGKNRLIGGYSPENVFNVVQGTDIIGELPGMGFYDQDGKSAKGKFEYLNYDNMRLGTWDLEWKFTPDDTTYGGATGKFTLNVREPEEIKVEAVEKPDTVKNNSENITLSAKKLTLDNGVEYDINLKNKIKGSIYKWTTTDKKVVKINKYGVVTGVKKGKAVITCTVTTPDNEVIKLKCNVTVK